VAYPSIPTLSALGRPSAGTARRLYDLGLVLGGAQVVALSAQIAIPLPFSPVPITGQTFGVVLVGALLGSRLGAAAMVLYLLEGLAGLPVFAGARAGLAVLAGPTGGYLLGFVGAAFATGWLAERGWDRRFSTSLAAMALGTIIIFAVGLIWLASFVGWNQTLPLGFYPFVPGAVVKLVLAAALLPAGWKTIRVLEGEPRG